MPDTPNRPLDTYNRKRDFSRTTEPKESSGQRGGDRFLVQKHDATRLHYDFRLELDGVLLSWAVTRGPSLDPAEKRLAVRTEDHPVSYAEFEGTIPADQYGGGTVMLWDQGSWAPEDDPREGLRMGKLRFTLHGQRMRGAWMLIRMRKQDRESWLLRKLDDAEAGAAETLISEHATSVKTGRTMAEIAGRSAKAPVSRQPSGEPANAAATSKRKQSPGTKMDGARDELVSHGIRISSPDRLQYGRAEISKRDLVAYYERVADAMLPHLRSRPLTLIRCPRGADERCFVQQHATSSLPEALRRTRLKEASGKHAEHVFVADLAGVMACVQIGVLELHGWASRVGAIARPDRLVLDLDPDPDLPFAIVREAARLIRTRLAADGLASWPMLSGGKGIHVIAPLVGGTWETLRSYAKHVAEGLEAVMDPWRGDSR